MCGRPRAPMPAHVLGHGVLIPSAPGTAEVAFAVADVDQHRGVATLLLEYLVDEAVRSGLAKLTAEVASTNHKMVVPASPHGTPARSARRQRRVRIQAHCVVSGAERDLDVDGRLGVGGMVGRGRTVELGEPGGEVAAVDLAVR